MYDNANKSIKDIVVLVQVSDVYSEDLLSLDLFVDPWRLFNSNSLNFEGNWIVKGTLQKNNSDSSRKRPKLYTPSVRWAMPATPRLHQTGLITLRTRKGRETYTHRVLDPGNIRLLYLLPGEIADKLQGVIIHIPYRQLGRIELYCTYGVQINEHKN
jgi:hypothetical protein